MHTLIFRLRWYALALTFIIFSSYYAVTNFPHLYDNSLITLLTTTMPAIVAVTFVYALRRNGSFEIMALVFLLVCLAEMIYVGTLTWIFEQLFTSAALLGTSLGMMLQRFLVKRDQKQIGSHE